MKTEPQWLTFRFLAQIPPPSHIGQSPPPSPSTPAYPASHMSPIPKLKPPRNLFAKTEPQRLGFQFLAQIPPPLHADQSPPLSPLTPAYPAPYRSLLPNYRPPRDSFVKTEPQWHGFRFLTPTTPPSRASQSPPPSPSTPAYPAPNRSPLPT
jgi:hypothetical protein